MISEFREGIWSALKNLTNRIKQQSQLAFSVYCFVSDSIFLFLLISFFCFPIPMSSERCPLPPTHIAPESRQLWPRVKANRICVSFLLLLLLLSRFSQVRLCATPEMAAHQAPLSLGFSRQEHWSGLPFPSPMHESEK